MLKGGKLIRRTTLSGGLYQLLAADHLIVCRRSAGTSYGQIYGVLITAVTLTAIVEYENRSEKYQFNTLRAFSIMIRNFNYSAFCLCPPILID